jgi:cell division protein FtsW
VTGWLAGQSIINLGAVVGLLPITGIPLPLVSFGGSAMVPTLVAVGMLLSFARCEPGADEALRGRRRLLTRLTGGGRRAVPARRTALRPGRSLPAPRRPAGRR